MRASERARGPLSVHSMNIISPSSGEAPAAAAAAAPFASFAPFSGATCVGAQASREKAEAGADEEAAEEVSAAERSDLD